MMREPEALVTAPRPAPFTGPRTLRQGVTLIEIAIVIAIVGIMAAIGIAYLGPLLPSWRTRRAAYEFAGNVQMARQLAVAEGNGYRVQAVAMDTDLDSETPSVGSYTVAASNGPGAAVAWDILPAEEGDGDADAGEGTFDFSEGDANNDALPGVSLAPFDGTAAPVDSALFFDNRGFLTNNDTDFGPAGTIDFVFVNKRARWSGAVEIWTVCVGRTGITRVESNRSPGCMTSAATTTHSDGSVTPGGGFTDDGASGFGTSSSIPTGSGASGGGSSAP